MILILTFTSLSLYIALLNECATVFAQIVCYGQYGRPSPATAGLLVWILGMSYSVIDGLVVSCGRYIFPNFIYDTKIIMSDYV